MERSIVDRDDPQTSVIAHAVEVIRNGGVVAIPTDTLYGLAADPFNPAAIDRVFEIKLRAAERLLPLLAADTAQVHEWIGELPPLGFLLAETFWPGPLTLVLRAPLTLDRRVAGDRHTVGVRVPAHEVSRALCRVAGRPLTGTSANVSGEPATDDPEVVARTLGARIDLLLDAGRTSGGAPSTIVDVTGAEPRLIRKGAIAWDLVQACVHHA